MPKRTRKLLVYLDQNFLSEMAKLDLNERVKPEFRETYELLHKGFVEEKLVVPQSWFHDVETSLAPILKERIVKHQNYLGQIRLEHPIHIGRYQVGRSLQLFLGTNAQDPLDVRVAFRDDPDQRVKHFNITVDSHLELQDFKSGRVSHATNLEALRQSIMKEGVSYAVQLEREYADQRRVFLQTEAKYYAHLCQKPAQDLLTFSESQAFLSTPVVSIFSRLYAALFTSSSTRPIKESDATDISIMSTFLPYMDVIATDAFIARQIETRHIDDEFDVKIFTAKTESLREFIQFLRNYLDKTDRVNRPVITAFVLPTSSIKSHSFKAFYQLGMAARRFRDPEYAEIYAFDDGKMPQYELRQVPGTPLPFYGLQEVTPIDLPKEVSKDQLLAVCREYCNSEKFVLIDEYNEFSDHFFHEVLKSLSSLMSTTNFPTTSSMRFCFQSMRKRQRAGTAFMQRTAIGDIFFARGPQL